MATIEEILYNTLKASLQEHLTAFKRGAGQVAAGAIEGVIGSPAAGDPTPGFQMQDLERAVPSGLWALTGLFGSSRGSQLFNAAAQRADEIASDLVGMPIQDPSQTGSTLDLISRVGGGVVVPGPKIGAARVPNAAARLGLEVLLPLNQTRSLPGLAAGIGIPVGAVEGIKAIDDLFNEPATAESDPLGAFSTAQEPVQEPEKVPSYEKLVDGKEVQDDMGPPDDPLGMFTEKPDTPDDPFDPLGAFSLDEESLGTSALAVAAGAATIGLGLLAYKRFVRGRGLKPTDYTGERPRDPQVTPFSVGLEAETLNKFAPLEDAVKRATGQAEDFIAEVRTTVTPGALSARITDFIKTGQLPNSSLRTTKASVHLGALARLSKDQLDQYDDTLVAMTQLDQMRRSGKTVWGNVTEQQLQAKVQAAAGDPVVAKLVQDAHEYYRTLRDYMYEGGIISKATRDQWAQQSPNYVPLRIDFGDTPDDLLSVLRRSNAEPGEVLDTTSFLKQREGLTEPGQLARPSTLMQQYGDAVIRLTERNRVRQSFIDQVLNTTYGRKFISKVPPSASDANTVRLLRNGVSERYKITDDAIRLALEFHPTQVWKMLNAHRSLFQNFTTGLVRPDFIPISWGYEVQSALAFQRKGEGLGILDELTGNRVSNTIGFDPSVVVSPITGAARGVYADMMYSLGRNMEMQLMSGGAVRGLLGDQLTAKIADIGMRAYEQSARRAFEQFGGSNAVFASAREVEDIATSLKETAPEFANRMRGVGFTGRKLDGLVRGYTHLFTQMHNGTRLQHYATNAVGAKTRQAAQRAAAGARASSGDVSLAGQNKYVTGYLSSIPYGNVAVRIMAEHAAALKRNPTRYLMTHFGVSAAAASLVYSQFEGNPAAQDHYFNQLTADQRTQFIPIYAPGTADVIARIPIEHQFRLTWGPFNEMLGALSGARYGHSLEAATLMEGVQQALDTGLSPQEARDLQTSFETGVGGVLFNPLPPIANAAFPALGVEAPQIGRFSQGQFGIGEVRTERITSDPTSRVANGVFSAQFEGVMAELLGSSARPLLDSVDAFHRNVVKDNPNFLESLGSQTSEELAMASEAAARRFALPYEDRFPIVYGTNIQQRLLVADANHKLVRDKMDGLREISKRFGLDLFNPGGATSTNARSEPLPTQVPPEVRGTALADVLAISEHTAAEYTKFYGSEVQRLFKELEDARANVVLASNPKLLRDRENALVREIRRYQAQAVQYITAQEAAVSEVLQKKYGAEGDDAEFTFDTFDPERLMQMRLPNPATLPLQ